MFTTPLRSENMPAIAPNTSSIENANICAISKLLKTVDEVPVLTRRKDPRARSSNTCYVFFATFFFFI